MFNLIKILRPVNLSVIFVTQVLIYYFLILPPLTTYGITPVLKGVLVPLFISVTVILAASANIINDLKDQMIDLINKPEKTYVNNKNKDFIAKIYWALLILGGSIAGYIAITIEKEGLFIIYPLTALILYYYSHILKSIPLVGNLVVSLFCALVIVIIWYAETSSIQSLGQSHPIPYDRLIYLLSGFSIFSFMSNFIRELIKDVEDFAGDLKGGIRTFTTSFGIERSKVLAMFSLMLLWVITIIWLSIGWVNYFGTTQIIISGILIMILPIYIWKSISRARESSSFSRISMLLKLYMFFGLATLLILA